MNHHGCKHFGVLLTWEESLLKCNLVTEHLVPLRSSPRVGHRVDIWIGKVHKFKRDELPKGIQWVKPSHSGKAFCMTNAKSES